MDHQTPTSATPREGNGRGDEEYGRTRVYEGDPRCHPAPQEEIEEYSAIQRRYVQLHVRRVQRVRNAEGAVWVVREK